MSTPGNFGPFDPPVGRPLPPPARPLPAKPPPGPPPPAYLCPRCLSVGPFAETTTPDGEKYWKCSLVGCEMDTIPFRYTERYDAFPPIPFALIGGTAQGKTRYLNALFEQLDRAAEHWPGFYTDPLDGDQYDRLRAKLHDYQTGNEEQGSQMADIPEPLVIRYSGVPRVGGCQMIFFDNAGEAFAGSATTFRRASGFMKRCPAVVWTLSLRERDSTADDPDRVTDYPPAELARVLNNYQQAMSTIGDDPKSHTLILALTKGERLLPLPGFPDSARRLLADDLFDPSADPWAKLERASDDLLAWLATTPHRGLLNRVLATFKRVRACVVSAQGRELDPNEPPRPFEPKAVLAPLFWLWRTDRPGVSVERAGRTTFYLSAAEAFAGGVGPGAVVRLERGEHRVDVPLKVQGPVTIEGADVEHTFLIGSGSRAKEEYVLGVGGTAEVRLSNLTVERRGDAPGDVVRVMGGRLVAERVRFRGGREIDDKSPVGSGVVIGRGGSGVLKGCQFLDNARSGVWVFTATGDKVELSDCVGRNNRTGLWVTGAGQATAADCTWERNRYGVRVTDQGQLAATGGAATANRKDGVEVSGDGRVSLVRFAATGNTRNGVEFAEAGGGSVDGGRYCHNTVGVAAGGHCQVQLLGVEASDNRADGLLLDGDSGGTVTGGTVVGNGGWGVLIQGAVNADCRDVRVVGNGTGGWKVAKTVPKLTRVANCGPGRDDRGRKVFG